MKKNLINALLLGCTIAVPAAWIVYYAAFVSCVNSDCIGPGIVFVALLFAAVASLAVSGLFFLIAGLTHRPLFGTIARIVLGFGLIGMLCLLALYSGW